MSEPSHRSSPGPPPETLAEKYVQLLALYREQSEEIEMLQVELAELRKKNRKAR